MFKGFSGYVQADAKSVYDILFRPPPEDPPDGGADADRAERIEVGCLSHARRRYWEATIAKSAVAREGLARLGRVFALERKWKSHPPAERTALRQAHARPHLEAFFAWAEEQFALVKDQRGLVPNGVPESGAQEAALVLDERELLLGPGEEGLQVRSRVRLAQRRAFGGRVALPLAFEGEDATEPRQSFAGHGALGDGRLPVPPAGVAQTTNLYALGAVGIGATVGRVLGRRPEQDVVDALGVGLHVAGEPLEHLADGGRGLARRVLEENVIAIGDLDEVVAAAARLPPPLRVARRLDQHADGVRGDAECGLHRVGAHGGDDGGAQRRAGVLDPPAHGAAVERQAEAREAMLLAMERQPIAVFVDDDVSDQRDRGDRARKDLGRHGRGGDLRGLGRWIVGVGDAVLDAREDQAPRTAALPGDLGRLLEADALGLALCDEGLDRRVGDLDALLRHLDLAQVSPSLGLGP